VVDSYKGRLGPAALAALSSVRVLHVTEETALRYAEVDGYLRKKGRPIPRNDVWIAASALEHGHHLLTLDVHFREIPLLLIQP
jgi:tRNA(fMet)-specific endonuclease VapC